jgi:hypothetical protein
MILIYYIYKCTTGDVNERYSIQETTLIIYLLRHTCYVCNTTYVCYVVQLVMLCLLSTIL